MRKYDITIVPPKPRDDKFVPVSNIPIPHEFLPDGTHQSPAEGNILKRLNILINGLGSGPSLYP